MSLTWDQALVSIAQRNNHRLPSGDFVSFRPDGSVAAGVSPSPAATTGSRTEKTPTKRRTVAQETGVRVCAIDSREAAGAITSSPDGPPVGKAAGPVAHAGSSGTARGER